MKISYFLKSIGLVTLCASVSIADDFEDWIYSPIIGLEITCDNSPYGDYTGSIEEQTLLGYKDVIGILVDSNSELGDVSGSIKVTHVNGGLAYGIWVEEGGSIGTVSGSISTTMCTGNSVGYLAGELENMYAIGLYNEATGDSTGINVDWSTMSFYVTQSTQEESMTARGIYLNTEGSSIATGCGEYIGGTIEVLSLTNSDGNSVGIELDNGASIGNLASSSTISAITERDGFTYGLYLQNGSSIGDLAGTISASSAKETATAIYLDNSTVGTISGTVSAYDKNGVATGISYNTTQQLIFSGATLSATTKDDLGTAIENTTYGINMKNEGATTSIVGDLNAGEQSIIFAAGQFEIQSNSWTASSISIGSDGGSSQLTLASNTSITAESLDFYIEDWDDFSSINLADGFSIDLSIVSTINVYVSDSLMDLSEFDITIIDGEIACMSGTLEVNFILSDGYSDANLSYGAASDGTSFIVSLSGNAVPEPTTASLSILALAGLMIRRRRQA